jgi:hypothetical protein
MSTNPTSEVPPPPPLQDNPSLGEYFGQDKPAKPRRWPWIAGIVAALVVGATIGAAGQTEPTAGEPEVVTDTVVETVTETVETTPQACIDALDTAESALGIASDFAGYTSELATTAAEAVIAAAYGDYLTLDSLTADVEDINAGINGLTADLTPMVDEYNAASAACRAGA